MLALSRPGCSSSPGLSPEALRRLPPCPPLRPPFTRTLLVIAHGNGAVPALMWSAKSEKSLYTDVCHVGMYNKILLDFTATTRIGARQGDCVQMNRARTLRWAAQCADGGASIVW